MQHDHDGPRAANSSSLHDTSSPEFVNNQERLLYEKVLNASNHVNSRSHDLYDFSLLMSASPSASTNYVSFSVALLPLITSVISWVMAACRTRLHIQWNRSRLRWHWHCRFSRLRAIILAFCSAAQKDSTSAPNINPVIVWYHVIHDRAGGWDHHAPPG